MNRWVTSRGYIYYPNYSSIDVLGYDVDGNILKSNNEFDIERDRGGVPNFDLSSDSQFKLKGSADISKFLSQAILNGTGEINGNFENASKAIITLNNPFTVQARSFAPIEKCEGHKTIVFATLNTGDMSVRIEDKNGVDITASFKVKNTLDASGNLSSKNSETIKITGSNFYIGYIPRKIKCDVVTTKRITIMRNESKVDRDIGIFVKYIDYRDPDGIGQALVLMRAGSVGSIGNEDHKINDTIASKVTEEVQNFDEIRSHPDIAKDKELTAKINNIGDPWKDAIPPHGSQKYAITGVTPPKKYYFPNFGKIGLIAKDRETGLFVQAVELNQQKIELDVMLIRFTEL
jgi:hypothetical protein